MPEPCLQKADGLGRFGSARWTRGDTTDARVPRRAAKGEVGWLRSIRLSQAYRAIYVIRTDGSVEFALVERVSKHEY